MPIILHFLSMNPVFFFYHALLEKMVLFRTRNGSIPRFIYGTPKWFYI